MVQTDLSIVVYISSKVFGISIGPITHAFLSRWTSFIYNYDGTNLGDDPGKKNVLTKRGTKYPETLRRPPLV